MLTFTEIQSVMARFGCTVGKITATYDTSRGDGDRRYAYVLDGRYVLKVNTPHTMDETRLQALQRLVARYRAIGVYCPAFLPAAEGRLSVLLCKGGLAYVCFVEECAPYPALGMEDAYDSAEVLQHLGRLAARYSGVDLMQTRSMWSIIDLAPLDGAVDEKQENADDLVAALRQWGYADLAAQVTVCNEMLRAGIQAVFDTLPRCVFQGDLNSTNLLWHQGHFAGLIDFNMAGTDVNINVFCCECNHFPTDAQLDICPADALLAQMDAAVDADLAVILRHYNLNDAERYALPYYRRIVALFQYPNVCDMVRWLAQEERRAACAALIGALVHRPL